MTEQDKQDRYSIPTIRTRAAHRALGYEIEIDVPAAAQHRPAVKRFLKGRYYEPFSHLAFTRILARRPGRTAVHAGAFFGDMLHTYAQVAETVFAFEPVLDNYVLAKLNADRMGLANVALINAGLSERSGLLKIQVADRRGTFAGGAAQIVGEVAPEGVRAETVPVFRLDDLPLGDVGLLQLDVEGHELPALKGAVRLIGTCRPVILIEDNDAACAGLLEGLGYGFCFRADGLNYWATPEDRDFVTALQAER